MNMKQRPTSASSNGASSAVVGGGGMPLNRRRGTAGSASSNLHASWKSPLYVLGMIAIVLTCGMIGLFVMYLPTTSQYKQSAIHNSHIVMNHLHGIPNLLRGKNDPIVLKKPGDDRNLLNEHDHLRHEGHDPDTIIHSNSNIKPVSLEDVKKQEALGGKYVPTVEYPYSLDPVPNGYNVDTDYHVLGGQRFMEYTTGVSPYILTEDIVERSNQQARSRRTYVHKTMEFVWSNYVKYAFGSDELEPVSGRGSNGWGGQGITLVDSLDTLWLMNMKTEFYQARDWVRDHLNHASVGSVSVFETTIRDLGGLLSAYDWSGDPVFLEKAIDLGERLLRSFDGITTGIPYGQVSLKDGSGHNIDWAGNSAILAEFGTIQLEFKYLAKASGRPELCAKTDKVFEIMNEISPSNGLFPYFYSNLDYDGSHVPKPANSKLTFGAMSDSFYEYMLKLWIQTDRKVPLYREMYDKAMDGMHNELLQTSTPSGLTYIADKDGDSMDHKMDHLVCFMGGLLALGAYTDPNGLDSPRAQRDLKTAKALTYTCYQMYARMNTGISAEYIEFEHGNDFRIGRGAPHYLLRPEAVESLFILNYLTKDPVYREWGWEIYQSIEKYCKTKYGYGSLNTVQDTHGNPRDKMESFFIAETLKYLYLLQDPDTEVDVLHTHVFNTEAHPVRIFSKMNVTTATS